MAIQVIKRDGRKQPFSRDNVMDLLYSLRLPEHRRTVDVTLIVDKIESLLTTDVTSAELSTIIAETTAALAYRHPHYDILAGQIELHTIFRLTPKTFSAACHAIGTGDHPMLTPTFMKNAKVHEQYFDYLINATPTFAYSYSTLRYMRLYVLLSNNGLLIERPGYMWMRISIYLHGTDVSKIIRTFNHLSQHHYALDTNVLLNAGTFFPYMASNFSLSLNPTLTPRNFYNSLAQSGVILSTGGEVGLCINSTPPPSDMSAIQMSRGVRPIIDVLNASLCLDVSDGTGAKDPAICAYIEPYHTDIFIVLDMIKERLSGDYQHMRNVDVVLWMPDLFMRRVHNNETWSLFSPTDVPYLLNKHGATFDAVYAAYEANPDTPRSVVSARLLMDAITRSQLETGMPSIMFKDAVNRYNNQSHLGTITHGGGNTSIIQYSSPQQTGVTHNASLILLTYVTRGSLNFASLHNAVQTVVYNLNVLIDRTSCPTPHSRAGNDTQRSIAVGVEGFAETLIALDIPYDSQAARELNLRLFETVYHAALTASVSYAKAHGCAGAYANSPLSKNLTQFDIHMCEQDNPSYDWTALRHAIATHGVANTLLVGLAPTSTTITNLTTSIHPLKSNTVAHISHRHAYTSVHPALVQKLESLGLWTDNIREQVLDAEGGSIQDIMEIPAHVKAIFKTAFEIGPLPVIDMARDRAPYICHAQGLQLHIQDATPSRIASLIFLTWRAGLKTGFAHIIPSHTRGSTPPNPEGSNKNPGSTSPPGLFSRSTTTPAHHSDRSAVNADDNFETDNRSDSDQCSSSVSDSVGGSAIGVRFDSEDEMILDAHSI